MNAVGIDVSKGRSTVCIMQPLGVVVAEPFDVLHNAQELKELAERLKLLSGETKVVMEYTGVYYEPIANVLHNAGIFVSVVNPLLIDDYGGNRVRKIKTDKKDALKIARYALDKWSDLKEYIPAENIRKTLKILNRQYIQYNKLLVMQKNNLISLLDLVFPKANTLFTSPRRTSDGHEKWIDFVSKFWHIDCVSKLFLSAFKTKYQSWCKKNNYNYSDAKAEEIYEYAKTQVSTLPSNDSVKFMITQAVSQLISLLKTLAAIRNEMDSLSSQLPEYDTVMSLFGVGRVYCSQLIAEIGDVRLLTSRKAIIGLAGIDPPPHDSGQVIVKSRSISKRGSPYLRKTLFQIMVTIIQNQPENDPVYQFLDKKRSEGKPYKVYVIAAANKFLRIYYARVREALNAAS